MPFEPRGSIRASDRAAFVEGTDYVVDELQAENERLRAENFALVDAMRDARALLHKPRPRAMAAASMLGDVLTTRALAMLPEGGEDDA